MSTSLWFPPGGCSSPQSQQTLPELIPPRLKVHSANTILIQWQPTQLTASHPLPQLDFPSLRLPSGHHIGHCLLPWDFFHSLCQKLNLFGLGLCTPQSYFAALTTLLTFLSFMLLHLHSSSQLGTIPGSTIRESSYSQVRSCIQGFRVKTRGLLDSTPRVDEC